MTIALRIEDPGLGKELACFFPGNWKFKMALLESEVT